MKPSAALWLGLALAVAVPAQAQDLEVDDETPITSTQPGRRTLAERIPAVTGRVFGKAGRVELAPLVGLEFIDPFYQHFSLGISASFHILEQLSIGASGEYFASVLTPVVVSGGLQRRRRYNHPVYTARVDVTWAPFYGKLSLMAETVVHFDTYLTVSGGVVGPLRTNAEAAWGGAVGQHYFLNDWLALRAELRMQMFEMARQPARDPTRSLEVLLTGTIGLGFFLPTDFERETL